ALIWIKRSRSCARHGAAPSAEPALSWPHVFEGGAVYKHLLVATDGSRLSGKAVTHAIALAQALKANLTAFYASPEMPLPAYADGVVYEPVSKKQYEALVNKEAQKILSAVQLKAEAGGVECDLLHTIANAP